LPSFTFAFCCHFNIGAGVFLLAVAAVTITRQSSHKTQKNGGKKNDNNDNGAKKGKNCRGGGGKIRTGAPKGKCTSLGKPSVVTEFRWVRIGLVWFGLVFGFGFVLSL